MSDYESVKNVNDLQKNPLAIFQVALFNSIGSLIYSEFIHCFKRQEKPVEKIVVPGSFQVRRFMEGYFSVRIKEVLIDKINEVLEKDYAEFSDLAEVKIINDEMFQKVFYDQMLPSMNTWVRHAIRKKLGLDDLNNQLFKEDSYMRLFNGENPEDEFYDYLANEILIDILLISHNVEKVERPCDRVTNVMLADDDIMTINHQNALCPINTNDKILSLNKVMELINFVTSSEMERVDVDGYKWKIDSGYSNKISICKLKRR